jgi:hypothetical protein
MELAELFVLPHHHRRQDLAMFETLMLSLYAEAPTDERTRAAALLAPRKDLPAAVAALIANEAIEIAEPVLTRAVSLTTIDRIRIIANRSEAHRTALASRADLDEASISALLIHGGPETIATLGNNQGLKLTAAQMNDLLGRATSDGRPLPQQGRMSNQSFGQSIDRFFDLERDERRRVLAAFEAETAFRRIGRYGRRTPPALRPGLNRDLIDAVFAGDLTRYAQHLSEQLGIEAALALRIITDVGGEPLVVALLACGLHASDATSIFVRSDPGLGWTYQTIRHLVQLYGLIGWRTAEAVIARWSGSSGAPPQRSVHAPESMRPEQPQARPRQIAPREAGAPTPRRSTNRE